VGVHELRQLAGGRDSKELQIQGPLEGVCAALILTLLPATLYGVVHWSMMDRWIHAWSFLLLASAPILFLSVLEVSPHSLFSYNRPIIQFLWRKANIYQVQRGKHFPSD